MNCWSLPGCPCAVLRGSEWPHAWCHIPGCRRGAHGIFGQIDAPAEGDRSAVKGGREERKGLPDLWIDAREHREDEAEDRDRKATNQGERDRPRIAELCRVMQGKNRRREAPDPPDKTDHGPETPDEVHERESGGRLGVTDGAQERHE